jgi:hypothetical protein
MPLKFKPLCQDDKLSVIYELRTNPKESRKIMASIAFKNTSSESFVHTYTHTLSLSLPLSLSPFLYPFLPFFLFTFPFISV